MGPYERVVVDTNVLLSAGLFRAGTPAAVVDVILQHGRLLFSSATFDEFETRIWRPKFDRYLSIELRKRLLHDFAASAEWVAIPSELSGQVYCRDPDDDAFIRVALAAGAKRLVTGDDDLLDLGSVGPVRIVTPGAAKKEIG